MAGSASLLWVAAGLIGLATVAPRIDRAVTEPDVQVEGFVIPRAPDGQFYIDARAGDVPVRFLVDNGIDEVLLTADDATRLGLDPSGPLTLPTVAIGPAVLPDVTVRIAPDLPVSLIGRAFLSRTANAEIRRDRLVLR